MKKKIFYIAVIVFFVLFLFGVYSFRQVDNYFKEGDRRYLINPSEFIDNNGNTMDPRLLDKEEAFVHRFEKTIPLVCFEKLGKEQFTIILYALNGMAHRVYVNDILIGGVGRFDGRSNIWNGMFFFDVDRALLKDVNLLRIETYTEYMIGTPKPVVITDYITAGIIRQNYTSYVENVWKFSVSFLNFGFVILIFLFFLHLMTKIEFLYMALVALFISIYSMDNICIYVLNVPYLFYKKIIILSMVFGVVFWGQLIYSLLDFKKLKIASILTAVGGIAVVSVPCDMISFKYAYNAYNIVILLNMLLWIFVLYKKRKNQKARIFLLSTFIGFMSVLNIAITLFNEKFDYFNTSPAIFILTVFLSIIFLLFEDFYEMRESLKNEGIRYKNLYHKSITDSMTEMFTHDYVLNIMDDIKEYPYCVSMVDIDNFKSVNDNFGHLMGDNIIKSLAKIIKEGVESSHVAGRYGGDEFIIILKGAHIKEAYAIMEGIRSKWENFILQETPLCRATISAGLYEVVKKEEKDIILQKTDNVLYLSKNSGKNRTSIYGLTPKY